MYSFVRKDVSEAEVVSSWMQDENENIINMSSSCHMVVFFIINIRFLGFKYTLFLSLVGDYVQKYILSRMDIIRIFIFLIKILFKMSIGTRVKQYREAKNWSQEDLAIRLDTTQTTISNIESDKNIPNSLLLNKIAKELEVDINDLLNDAPTVIYDNEFNDQSVANVNQYNPIFNIQSPELLESIIKNQEQIAKLMEIQSKLIESLLKK
ncbi:hypothetical protein CW752_08275 [Chryseobacterium sp. PMSZPI]|nr:hypothetical protein CW752_08275 [Chryseobacterium sp. PMSZPI]